jgi:hypothetical protein
VNFQDEVGAMSQVSLIMVQFLNWVAERPRSYADAMDAWKTSCPRLSVWEDATLDGLVKLERGPGGTATVRLTSLGRAALREHAAGIAAAVASAAIPGGYFKN